MDGRNVCVLIPCLDEEPSIAGVVQDFQSALPGCRILVVDNGSEDRTSEVARASCADVLVETRRGKGQAVLAALPLIEHDLMIMVDGAGIYPAEGAVRLLERNCKHPADMIVGVRCPDSNGEAVFRPLHRVGSQAFERVLRLVFDYQPRDVFSGLRLFSKRFYKNVPIMSRGFEL